MKSSNNVVTESMRDSLVMDFVFCLGIALIASVSIGFAVLAVAVFVMKKRRDFKNTDKEIEKLNTNLED